MSTFSRVTVVGSRRRAEVAVHDDDPLAAVLPRLLELLAEPVHTAARPPVLVRTTGEALDPTRTPKEQALRDGECLRLVRSDEAPPPPEVADVTDVLGDSLPGRRGLWSRRARELTGVAAISGIAVVAGLLLPPRLLPAGAAQTWTLGAAAVLTGGAAALGLFTGSATWGVRAATGAALGLALPVAVAAGMPRNPTTTGWVLPVATAVALAVWGCLAVVAGLGLGRGDVLAGSAIGLASAALPVLVSSAGPARAAVVSAVGSLVLCGLLPRYASTAGGLTALDNHVIAGAAQPRPLVDAVVDRTHAALTWSTVAVAGGLAGPGGVLLTAADPWAVGVGLAVVAATALRTRVFPLAAQHAALWAALAAVTVQGLVGRALPSEGPAAWVLAGLLGLLAAAVAAGVLLRPPAHVRALLRKAGDALERLAVLAVVPAVLGAFGVYADLLRRFS